MSLPKSTLNNGSLYVHVFLGPKGKSPLRQNDLQELSVAVVPLTRYAVPQSTVYSLLSGDDQVVSLYAVTSVLPSIFVRDIAPIPSFTAGLTVLWIRVVPMAMK